MALIKIEKLQSDVLLGLWEIESEVEALRPLVPGFIWEKVMTDSKSDSRQKEKLAVYALLYAMTGNRELIISHEPSGRPIVKDWNFSVSHTRGYAAVILSRESNVAVDVEYMSNRVDRIAERFVRADEYAPDTLSRLIVWCAKETLYKLFYEENLQYFDMRLLTQPALEVSVTTEGKVRQAVIENVLQNVKIGFYYRVTPTYVLTWAFK